VVDLIGADVDEFEAWELGVEPFGAQLSIVGHRQHPENPVYVGCLRVILHLERQVEIL
jgi:hypothetical protein